MGVGEEEDAGFFRLGGHDGCVFCVIGVVGVGRCCCGRLLIVIPVSIAIAIVGWEYAGSVLIGEVCLVSRGILE